ncbi:FliI/YscN family ATPase [Sinorhizobium alkalisoli]|uniref:Flagellum-specific ATP synthase FliL n=1 Tax=Sinorhizobium alkalisoli TaxID=1752398 RepID=A0A1E3V7D1_9HYPH|nr:FliI/YscN family ATPase [Sinorhizobium alkalisoli]ODR89337.1 flagellum-specific ATP synthase FliL [Sinorhizobium alkalisoli]QFI65887.1 Flagellum-specific ATP synthase FliI [Sinorhizobium alkalisoli]
MIEQALSDPGELIQRLRRRALAPDTRPVHGRVRRITGIIVHATAPMVRIGELCHLRDPVSGATVPAEVVGFEGEEAVLTPIGELEGMSTRAEVIATGKTLQIPVGEGLLGRVLNPLGEVLDDVDDRTAPLVTGKYYPTHRPPPNALRRDLITEPLQLGVRAIDGLLTIARGQRVGIFGEPGVGKSSLLSTIVRGTKADVVVIGLVGERGREVREFIEGQLGEEGRKRSVVVVATSDRPAIERVKAAYGATAIAEYFRDQGQDVLLLMDSVTRFARAQREIGLAAGEPPTRRGYPPSLFAALPRLLERAGPGRGGTITALYTVLTEGDGTLDPVAEETKAILDGHIMLSSSLAERNFFPAIDVLKSRSRLMESVAGKAHRENASHIRALLARYEEIELLLRVGEYERGVDALSDEAIEKREAIEAFLRQDNNEFASLETTEEQLKRIAS